MLFSKPVKKIDCLFIHVPKFNNYYTPLNEFIWINYMPMGLLALADFLCKNGYISKVLHLGVEWIKDRKFSVIEYLSQFDVKIIGLTLHWHYQSYDVVRVAEDIKKNYPNTYILLGGFTASYYHSEIMENFSFIDGIIRGDGELPVLKLAQQLSNKKQNLEEVPNLTWRDDCANVKINPHAYVATAEDINKLCFTNLFLLENYTIYINRFALLSIYLKYLPRILNWKFFSYGTPTFILPVGRGCPVDCTFCSGSNMSQRLVSNREKIIFRAQDKVIESIIEAQGYGYKTFHVCFDPYPENPEYWLGLFSKIREKGLKIYFTFESHGLPKKEFINEFRKTFTDNNSSIMLSPESASEAVRKFNKGHFYTNQELIDAISYIDNLGIKLELFFSLGMPGDNIEGMKETAAFGKMLKRKFKGIKTVRTCITELEPASPWYLNPEKYGIVSSKKCFIDFYNRHKSNQSHESPGYCLPDFFKEEKKYSIEEFEKKIKEIKCKYFCYVHINPRETGAPWVGNLLCSLMKLYWLLTGRSKRENAAC